MSKLYVLPVVVALLALAVVPALAVDLVPTTNAGDPAEPFGATLNVTIEVEPYADVTWASESLGTITLSGPADWEKGVNWDIVPLSINTNCNVNVTVYEGLSDWVADKGIPQEGIWGQAFDGNGDHLIYASNLQLLVLEDGYQSSSQPWGSVYDYGTFTNPLGAGVGVALPNDSGTGSMGVAWLNYETGQATGPTGPNIGPQPFDGHLTMYPAIGLKAHGGSLDGKDWTSIAAGEGGTALVYAVISALEP